MRIVFLGPPGAGKGTQAVRLAAHLNVPHLSTGDMFRAAAEKKTEVGLLAQEYFTTGRLVPDDVVIGVVEERLADPDCSAGCVLDGFPRTLDQAEALDRLLGERNSPIEKVLDLAVPEEVLIERMLARGRVDDTRESIAKRMQEYTNATQPLTDYYRRRGLLTSVDGEGTPDEVAIKIHQAVAQQE